MVLNTGASKSLDPLLSGFIVNIYPASISEVSSLPHETGNIDMGTIELNIIYD